MQLIKNYFKKIFPKSSTLLGLTVEQEMLRIVELGRAGSDFFLLACFQMQLPLCFKQDSKSVFACPEFPNFLKKVLQDQKILTRQVALALPYTSVLFKTVELDKNLTEAEIFIRIRSQAQQYFNYPIADLMIDFEVIGNSKNNQKLQQIRWVAAKRAEIELQTNALAAANLSLVAVEVDSFALERAAKFYMGKHNIKVPVALVVQVCGSYVLSIMLHLGIVVSVHTENFMEDSDAAVLRILQIYTSNPLNEAKARIFLAGHISEVLMHTVAHQFKMQTDYLDVLSLLQFYSSNIRSHEFSMPIGLAMKQII